MASNKRLLVLPGDGIGPEVMGEVHRVITWMDQRRAVSFDVTEDLVGGDAEQLASTSPKTWSVVPRSMPTAHR